LINVLSLFYKFKQGIGYFIFTRIKTEEKLKHGIISFDLTFKMKI